MSSKVLPKRRGFLLLTITAAALTVLIGFVLWNSIQTHSVQTLQEEVAHWQPLLTGVRWVLIGSLALAWPYLCHCLVRSGNLGKSEALQLTSLRWRIVGWLVVIELILGQGMIVKLLASMVGKTE